MSWLSHYFRQVTGNDLSEVIPDFSRGEGSTIFDVGIKVSPSQETQNLVKNTGDTLRQYQGIILVAIILAGIYTLRGNK